ncbi:MAG: DUF2510 domain-containing protein, partial [Actinomycetes bacterium]
MRAPWPGAAVAGAPGAGWYDDPGGEPVMRWWDGRGWTEAVADRPDPWGAPASADHAPPASADHGPAPTPGYRRPEARPGESPRPPRY